MPFPMQRCFQTPDLLFGAFDHLFLRIRSDGHSESHPDSRMQFTPILGAVIPQVFDSMRYGTGMTRRSPSTTSLQISRNRRPMMPPINSSGMSTASDGLSAVRLVM